MTAALRILFTASEAHPLIKTGGLGDVAGALPIALRKLGLDVRLLLPGYRQVTERVKAERIGADLVLLPGIPAARLLLGTLPGSDVPLYILDCPKLYHRDGGPYGDEEGHDWIDNAHRFGLLARVASMLAQHDNGLNWQAELVHCNDWQTGLVPAYMHHYGAPAASLLTIHNLAFQGNFTSDTLPSLGLPWESFQPDGLEFYGLLSFLKAGIHYADHITTVSPTYAREIQTQEFGYRMEGLLQSRSAQLTGILNGIDNEVWSPASDPALASPYSRAKLAGKAVNKKALQAEMGLPEDDEQILLGTVSRLTWQKGVDLILDALPELLHQPVQFVILGTGDKAYEARWLQLAETHPDRVAVMIGYDEGLAHRIEAGADLFLMPSRFEPCGLNQMYSMRYGTPPVVRRTGGLADSVIDTDVGSLRDGTATGFVFNEASPADFIAAVQRGLLVHHQKKSWRSVQQHGMARDFSWQASARQYMELYQSLLD